MGGGLADHEPAVAATGGSELRDASKDASKVERKPLTPRELGAAVMLWGYFADIVCGRSDK